MSIMPRIRLERSDSRTPYHRRQSEFPVSPFGSGATKAASGVSKNTNPTVAATASSEQVYDQGYKYLFGTFTPNDTLTEPLSALVTKRDPNIKRVAILARNDLFPLAIGNEMEKSAKKRNLEVVMFEKYAIGTMDHASAIYADARGKAGLIFATGYINDLILIRKQMSDLGNCADRDDDRRPGLQGVYRCNRSARRKRIERRLVAPGCPL
jgi:branched-chain amino acid transport system substrate-binding protein